LLWRGADHGSSKKRGGECILIYANGLAGRDVQTINGRSACAPASFFNANIRRKS